MVQLDLPDPCLGAHRIADVQPESIRKNRGKAAAEVTVPVVDGSRLGDVDPRLSIVALKHKIAQRHGRSRLAPHAGDDSHGAEGHWRGPGEFDSERRLIVAHPAQGVVGVADAPIVDVADRVQFEVVTPGNRNLGRAGKVLSGRSEPGGRLGRLLDNRFGQGQLAHTLGHQGLQLVEVFFVHAAGCRVVTPTYGRGHSDHFAHHAGGPHYADRTQGHVGDADVAPGHEQVFDVTRIEAAVRDRVRLHVEELRLGTEGLFGEALGGDGIVQVH